VTLLLALVGAVAGLASWWVLRPVLAMPGLARTNHRDELIPTAGGLAILLALAGPAVVGSIGRAADASADVVGPNGSIWIPVAIAALGFGILGLIDDVAAAGSGGGFRGHVSSLFRGRLTTGGLKLLGGGAVALVAVSLIGRDSVAVLFGDAAIVALAANLANLLDLAPGRTTKVAVLSWVALVAAGGLGAVDHAASFVVGAAAGILVPELRERLMLGDTGANVIGATLGLTAVAQLGGPTRLVLALVLIVLNVAAEIVSFSHVINQTAPLRWFDRLGRAG
jgi:UDP-N-acetylmuramyl pentapeptide phosphotransferase/UDP-N-acetylglucosamine-1-phosphate transferase